MTDLSKSPGQNSRGPRLAFESTKLSSEPLFLHFESPLLNESELLQVVYFVPKQQRLKLFLKREILGFIELICNVIFLSYRFSHGAKSKSGKVTVQGESTSKYQIKTELSDYLFLAVIIKLKKQSYDTWCVHNRS